MRFLEWFKPALSWLFLLGALGLTATAQGASLFGRDMQAVGNVLGLDDAELQWIREHPQVVVASLPYPLYLFKDESGEWAGLNNDILGRISLLTRLRFVHQEVSSTVQMLELLENGTADMSTTLAINEERRAFLNFSHAYGGSSWVFVVRAGESQPKALEHLAGKRLALPARHALERKIQLDYPAIKLHTVMTQAEARALVENGEVDATIENETGAYLYPAGALKVGHSVDGIWEPDHLAMHKKHPQLLSIINKALDAFTAAELRAMRQKWVGGIAQTPPSLWQRLYSWLCLGGIVTGAFFLISMAWRRRFNEQVQLRLKAEQQLSDQLAFQSALLNAIPTPIFVRDQQARLVLCNKSYEERFSVRQDQVKGRLLTDIDLLPRETAEQLHRELIEQLASQKSRFINRQLTFREGTLDVYQWTVPFYSAQGELRGLMGGWIESGDVHR